jgi:hypothetical protein
MIVRCFTAVMAALAVTGFGDAAAAQSPAAAPAATPATQVNSICGSQPSCYEASDFAATVTDFRTTTQGYYKIIDATVRFTNKTASTLGLGYANGSGMATDDRGNRYQVGGANAFRGIGAVNGANFDPKMVIRPGGFADARFELLFSAGAEVVVGLTFELDLTVDQLNAVEGNQFTMAGETPLQFKSLINGSTGAAPGQVAYSSGGQVAPASQMAPATTQPTPCSNGASPNAASKATSVASATNSSTVQTATANATTATANAAAAVANIGSIFGGKKTAAPTAKTAASTTATAPCAPAGPTAPAAATASAAAPHPATAAATASRAATVSAAAPHAATVAATAPHAPTPTPAARNVVAAPAAKAATTGNITTARVATVPVKAQSKDSGVVAIPAKP